MMMSWLVSALKKLGLDSVHHPLFQDLPARSEDSLWNDFRETFGLNLFELGALKNARCDPPTRPQVGSSPRCDESCLLLISIEKGEGKKPYYVEGTAFAVGERVLLTAGHCIGASCLDYYVTPSIESTDKGDYFFPGGMQRVEVVARGRANNSSVESDSVDYAVLQLVNGSESGARLSFTLTPIPIYTGPLGLEMEVKLYSAFFAHEFNEFQSPSCGIGVFSKKKIAFLSNHQMFVGRDYLKGCSGGPYILNDHGVGKVAALHIESLSTFREINVAAEETVTNEENIEIMTDIMSGASHTHTSIAKGLIISRCHALCEVLRRLEVLLE